MQVIIVAADNDLAAIGLRQVLMSGFQIFPEMRLPVETALAAELPKAPLEAAVEKPAKAKVKKLLPHIERAAAPAEAKTASVLAVEFVAGKPKSLRHSVLDALEAGPFTSDDLAIKTGIAKQALYAALSALKMSGAVKKNDDGKWEAI